MIKVDLQKAARLGIDLDDAMQTLQSYIGSFYSSNFVRFGQMYKVMIQASPEYRMNPEDVYLLFAKNRNGQMVPYSNFLTMEKVYGPNQITRYNMFPSALITGEGAKGVSSGEVIATVESIARECLPRGYDIEWSGVTKEEKESGGQAVRIFAICLLFVYLLLAAQYESLWLPFPVILSLPPGVFGSYLFLQLLGLENNIYAQGCPCNAHRPAWQERHPHSGDGQPVQKAGQHYYQRSPCRCCKQAAAHPDDIIRIHLRTHSTDTGQRSRSHRKPFYRNGCGRRHADRNYCRNIHCTRTLFDF